MRGAHSKRHDDHKVCTQSHEGHRPWTPQRVNAVLFLLLLLLLLLLLRNGDVKYNRFSLRLLHDIFCGTGMALMEYGPILTSTRPIGALLGLHELGVKSRL